MLNNKTYNLMIQLTQEHKSLWRIKNDYLKDSEGDQEITEFWKKMEKDKENHIEELTELIKAELK